MIRRLTFFDFKTVFYNVGRVIFGLSLTMLIPIITSIAYGEFSTVIDFLIGMAIMMTFGLVLSKFLYVQKSPTLFQAIIIAPISWLIACALSAVPLVLSGHFSSFLDAYFEVMSAFTTTGLVLIKDIDHISNGLNMWRHLLCYIGGQGIIVLALTFLIRSTGGAFKIMVGEAKEEALEPSIKKTARNIWVIALVSLVCGTLFLAIAAWIDGHSFGRGLLHGLWIFFSAWSTSGFAPTSQSVINYHSMIFEYLSAIFMIMGSLNFALHYAVWRGNLKELWKNIEVSSFAITLSITSIFTVWGLATGGVFSGINTFLRRGIFTVVSAHTGCGQTTLYSPIYASFWAPLAFAGVCLAMMIGGSAASTAGGFKGLRMGVVFKGIAQEIKQILAPQTAVVASKFHHIKDQILEPSLVRQAALIIIAYIVLYGLGTLIGAMVGYPLGLSAFESISAAANVGLTTGITLPTMPAILKITYIFQMWIGRLEFMAVYVLFGTMAIMVSQALKKKRI